MGNKVNRGEFIKLGSLTFLGVLTSDFLFARDTLFGKASTRIDSELLKRLVIHNDIRINSILDRNVINKIHIQSSSRALSTHLSIMAAGISHKQSKYFKSNLVADTLNQYLDVMLKQQYGDGTLDAGGNRQSPPDTAFVLEYMCSAAMILNLNEQKKLLGLRNKLKTFIVKAGDAMITGGVHTPNHRWVVSEALAYINSLYPNSKYVKRIDEWLTEGVYLNKDGHYSERSTIYSAVINKAFITMARLLNRPELLDNVGKNLTMYYYHTETNGDVVSVESRRQDQFMTSSATRFYLQYRFMAIYTKNPVFVHMVKTIENLPDFTKSILSNDLVFFMQNETLQKQIPVEGKVTKDYEKFFAVTNLARIRRGNTSITLFGGNDKPVMIVSGRSSSPNFLMYRKGNSILKYMRLSTSFFRMGYFSSEGIEKRDNTYILKETKEAYYYQPLAEEDRKDDGDYKLSESPDGRFWSKMDFNSRSKSNVKKQDTIIEITENNGALDLDFKVGGPPNVEVTIEMCFEEGSRFLGADKDEKGNYLLKSGYGELSMGEDTIKLGPGKIEHENVNNLDSESITFHNGSLRTDGIHVYITGFTPFHHKMTIA